ncbi:bifunctional metallophosphatase/5'-nucleotidase [Carboxylicivirga sp. N1Y90]|uniref:bifunctional metallophosphatase/5'-nucleotidase n=1 Tax=Carboxylicivirga fragile TaxID=3417571 RepID=UPI003D3316DE|nr:metallophosphatase [Marinilabiliaceae bacterium N1Y90]
MPQNRRQFIKNALSGTAAISTLPLLNSCSNKQAKLTILHTNDVHSQIEALANDHWEWPGKGGFSKRAALIDDIRKSAEHTLLLDAGDIFQGTPYFNFYKGKLEIELMNKMHYDAATIGNHEFDNGIVELSKRVKEAKFPFISSNYDFNETPLHGLTFPYKVFNKGAIKIGILGVGIELEGLVNSASYGKTKYNNPISVAEKTANHLRNNEQCDYVICLSHLGYKYESEKISDHSLAEATSNIDLILGGHTHTYLEKPTKVKNAIGKEVIINQAAYSGVCLGRIDVSFTNAKPITSTLNSIYHV